LSYFYEGEVIMGWSIGKKIGGLVAFSIVTFLILGITSYQMINKLIESNNWDIHTYKVLQNQEQILSLLKDAETGQRGYLLTGEEQYLEPYNLAVKSVMNRIDNAIELTKDNSKQQQRIAKLKLLAADKFIKLDQAIVLRRKKGFESALKNILTGEGKNIMDEIRNVNDEIIKEENELLKTRELTTNSNIIITESIIIYGTALSVIIIFVIGFLVVRNISKPLNVITKIATLIAANDLSVNILLTERKDEVGILNQAFRQMVETLRKSIKDISEGINLLSSTSSEILAATTQVASGSAETATAISETTTTVEEVRQAAQLSSQKASRVSENAQQAVQVTQAGQKAVDETISGMHEIQNQMESVANTIIRLSEQSQQIGGIIASVTDLADQSNLLAVNAAIEAAKAGEQGKGFAVVAQEIKSLAQQSKQATIQVRNILSDIQKAISSAVMATEKSSKAVDTGVKQSTQAGESIRKLAEGSNKAVDAATQIVASSQQQAIGMDQIVLAMNNINQAGTENAASMMQAEKAAKGLNELGQKLKHLVEQYKI
jgi:methyl-accepting chemotaxis protein